MVRRFPCYYQDDLKPEILAKLRLVINENLRVQRGGAELVPYIDVSNSLGDIAARQNHAVFGRRGCGKTLLLHYSATRLSSDIRPVYLNCEDFKKHTFPNVLIEILDALFAELEKRLTGWFGRKKRSRELIGQIRKDLENLRQKADQQESQIHEAEETQAKGSQELGVKLGHGGAGLNVNDKLEELSKLRPNARTLSITKKCATSICGCRD